MGRDKALLPLPPTGSGQSVSGQTFLSAVIDLFSAYTEMVIVVVGANEESLAPVIFSRGGFMVRNPDPARGQFSSLQVGLHEVLMRGRDAAMVTLVDRPPVSAPTVERLCEAYQVALNRAKWAVVPEFQGKHGHPILVSRDMIERFLKAPAGETARDVEHQNRNSIEYVSVEDRFVTANINTPEDYAALSFPLAPEIK
jgi:molybdenum cofactor cytidylyltransferase